MKKSCNVKLLSGERASCRERRPFPGSAHTHPVIISFRNRARALVLVLYSIHMSLPKNAN